jgi:hypothetical protein
MAASITLFYMRRVVLDFKSGDRSVTLMEPRFFQPCSTRVPPTIPAKKVK